jgi:hypothetical protein
MFLLSPRTGASVGVNTACPRLLRDGLVGTGTTGRYPRRGWMEADVGWSLAKDLAEDSDKDWGEDSDGGSDDGSDDDSAWIGLGLG